MWNEGTDKDREDPEWRMSLCSLVWKIDEFGVGEPACKRCMRKLRKALRPLFELGKFS